ncbi:MAG: hypothetical protein DHS20C20_25450 [Ardenticatenaceae bacterium]|nr:MAG: hypothetical protein DHS20C20_25450 [Ardenticatenaceae bacterium]
MNLWTIIPVKSLHRTKSRLGALLSSDERAALTLHLLERTLRLLLALPQVRETAVITQDPTVAEIATHFGCRWLADPPDSGLNGAVTEGFAFAGRNGASHCLILPSDLPFLAGKELAELVNLAETAVHPPTLILCSDQQQQGTNALIVPTGNGFRFRYGRNSFQRHQQEAGAQGLSCRLVTLPSIQFDLDTEQDYTFYTQKRHPISPEKHSAG